MKRFFKKVVVPKTAFTIVVPFRNEKENLPNLLYSISLLDYPKELVEVILVDAKDSVFMLCIGSIFMHNTQRGKTAKKCN